MYLGRRKAIEKASPLISQESRQITGNDDTLSNAFAAATAALLPSSQNQSLTPTGPTTTLHRPRASVICVCPEQSHHAIPPLISYVECVSPDSPNTSFTLRFPLSPDYYLLTLIQYNVLRGLTANLIINNILSELPETCVALTFPQHNLPSEPPPIFLPTPVQTRIPHSLWIDSIPDPHLRDNLILATTVGLPRPLRGKSDEWENELLDEDELCSDICGGL
jgi:hypothetical protein